MRKKRIVLFTSLLLLIVLIMSGCSGGKAKVDSKTLYERILTSLSTLENYEADATVRYISNNNSHAYRTKQYAKTTGEYRIDVTGPEEVVGNITIFDGTTICQYNENVAGKIAIGTNESSERLEILLTSFVRNYFATQEVTLAVSSMGANEDVTVIEAKIPGEHPYLTIEKLWIDNETLLPLQMVVYDPEEAERIVVTYHEISYNVELDSALFVIKK